MSDHLYKTTHELISNIEKKDRRFRFSQSLFMILVFVALILIISAQQRTLNGVKTQLAEQDTIAEQTNAHNDDNQDIILRRLNCKAVFFNQTNRQNLSIKNIDKCTLDRNGDIQQYFNNNTSKNDVSKPPNLIPAPNQ